MIKYLAILALVSVFSASTGCRRHPEHASYLREYAKRECIPEEIVNEQGDRWPQFLYDYSISHGPNFTKKEMREFTSWKEK